MNKNGRDWYLFCPDYAYISLQSYDYPEQEYTADEADYHTDNTDHEAVQSSFIDPTTADWGDEEVAVPTSVPIQAAEPASYGTNREDVHLDGFS